jgi:hypothetical protein
MQLEKQSEIYRKEYETRGKNNNNLENKRRIIEEANKIISEELRFLNGYYNYDLSKYYNCELIYGSCFLSFFNLEEINLISASETVYLNNYSGSKKNRNIISADICRILNLIVGFELLGIGINVHGTTENIINNIYTYENAATKDSDKNYTLELLFGDIFYSRAVIYLIKYDDFFIFEDILKSLIALHYSRLTIHQKLVKLTGEIPEGRLPGIFKENIFEIKNLNALLKSSFLIGMGASNIELKKNLSSVIFRVIENMVLLKTYIEIENHLNEIPEDIKNSERYEYMTLVISKKESLKRKIKFDTNLIKPIWLRKNFTNLKLLS